MGAATAERKVRIWDLPTRLIHWSLPLLVAGLWYTGQTSDIATHKTLGLTIFGLVTFRTLWGFIGSSTARFAGFVRGPGTVLAYLKSLRNGTAAPSVGHNPIGALSVVTLLCLLAAQIGSGLFAQDVDGLESGPLSYLVSYDTADAARGWHHLTFDLLLVMTGFHLAAILLHLAVKRDNLIRPMVTGSKQFATAVVMPTFAPAWRVLLCAMIAAGIAEWVAAGAPLGF